MNKYIIFGGNGMLADAVKKNPFFIDHKAPDIAECDITDINAVEEYISATPCEYLINCAAYTDVTKAETDFDTAVKINANGAKNLALLSKKYNAKLIHISTDFVYKGDQDIVYNESLEPNPVNNYGLSKLMGENYVLDTCHDALILRVSWLYGPNGRNFVSTISELMQSRPQLKIVSDQYGKTTYTPDVANAIARLIEKDAKGIYHFANEGVSSRYEFTMKIFELLRKHKDFECEILPIPASEYADPTPRPTWSVLGCEKYESLVGEKVRRWEDALTEYVR